MKLNIKSQIAITVIAFLFMGIGYAYLNASLQLEGTAHIGSSNWNLKFSNATIVGASATTTYPSNSNSNKPTIISGVGTHEIDYQVIFNQPGDYYEFTFDVVNSGGFKASEQDAKKVFKIKIGDGEEIVIDESTHLTTSIPSYLNYSIDDVTNHWNSLEIGTTATGKIKLELKSDITPEELALVQGKVISVKEIFEYTTDFNSNSN